MNQEAFVEILGEIEKHFGKKLSTFAKNAWFEKLSELSEDQFYETAKEVVCVSRFMPTCQDLTKIAAQLPRHTSSQPVVTSTEPAIVLTEEERLANIKKIREMVEKIGGQKTSDRNQRSQPHSQNNNKQSNPNNKFETMRQMLKSGSPPWIREAITWAKTQPNVQLIYEGEAGDTVIDMVLGDDEEF
jgi:hypothetical protein